MWTMLLIAGAVVVVLIAGAVGFIAYWHINQSRTERRVMEEGRAMATYLVMANNELYKPDGELQLPGTLVFGFYPPSPKLMEVLGLIAHQVYGLYQTSDLDSLSPECREFAMTIQAHRFHEDRRYRVPQEIAGSLTIFAADIWIHRERLRDDWTSSKVLACAVTGEDEGEIAHIPLDHADAQAVYAAAFEE